MTVIIRAGRIRQDSELGQLHVDRQLDAAQLQLVVAALNAIGWPPRLVTEVELSEAGALVRAFDTHDDGRPNVNRQRVRRVRFDAGGASIVDP